MRLENKAAVITGADYPGEETGEETGIESA